MLYVSKVTEWQDEAKVWQIRMLAFSKLYLDVLVFFPQLQFGESKTTKYENNYFRTWNQRLQWKP